MRLRVYDGNKYVGTFTNIDTLWEVLNFLSRELPHKPDAFFLSGWWGDSASMSGLLTMFEIETRIRKG